MFDHRLMAWLSPLVKELSLTLNPSNAPERTIPLWRSRKPFTPASPVVEFPIQLSLIVPNLVAAPVMFIAKPRLLSHTLLDTASSTLESVAVLFTHTPLLSGPEKIRLSPKTSRADPAVAKFSAKLPISAPLPPVNIFFSRVNSVSGTLLI